MLGMKVFQNREQTKIYDINQNKPTKQKNICLSLNISFLL